MLPREDGGVVDSRLKVRLLQHSAASMWVGPETRSCSMCIFQGPRYDEHQSRGSFGCAFAHWLPHSRFDLSSSAVDGRVD